MKNTRRGFAPIIAMLMIAAILGVGGVIYVASTKKGNGYLSTNSSSTQGIVGVSDWKTVSFQGFTIKYPPDWSAKEGNMYVEKEIGNEPKDIYGKTLSLAPSAGLPIDSVNIGIFGLPGEPGANECPKRFIEPGLQCDDSSGIAVTTRSGNVDVLRIFDLIRKNIKKDISNGQLSYIKKAYELNGKRYIDADYFQALSGTDAVIYALKHDMVRPANGYTKEQDLAFFESEKAKNPDKIEYVVNDYLEQGSFPNGVWLDINENPKIRTLEVDLKSPVIKFAYDHSYTIPGMSLRPEGSESVVYIGAWDDLKKLIAYTKGTYPPFMLTLSGEKVTDIAEIYRP